MVRTVPRMTPHCRTLWLLCTSESAYICCKKRSRIWAWCGQWGHSLSHWVMQMQATAFLCEPGLPLRIHTQSLPEWSGSSLRWMSRLLNSSQRGQKWRKGSPFLNATSMVCMNKSHLHSCMFWQGSSKVNVHLRKGEQILLMDSSPRAALAGGKGAAAPRQTHSCWEPCRSWDTTWAVGAVVKTPLGAHKPLQSAWVWVSAQLSSPASYYHASQETGDNVRVRLSPWHPYARPEPSSRLLVSAWLSPRCSGHFIITVHI